MTNATHITHIMCRRGHNHTLAQPRFKLYVFMWMPLTSTKKETAAHQQTTMLDDVNHGASPGHFRLATSAIAESTKQSHKSTVIVSAAVFSAVVVGVGGAHVWRWRWSQLRQALALKALLSCVQRQPVICVSMFRTNAKQHAYGETPLLFGKGRFLQV